jgi:hypothetical protein
MKSSAFGSVVCAGSRGRVAPTASACSAFTKPVDPLVGQAIEVWEAIRPAQPPLLDRRTGELVALLFCLRAKRVAGRYFNQALIPALCRKAGMPWPMPEAASRAIEHAPRSPASPTTTRRP